MDLFPYQIRGAKFLAAKKRALLADDPGLGKSAQAIAACDAVDATDVTVICPASLRENWKREFDRFGKMARDLHVYSYAKVPDEIADTDVLILDEPHYLKNHKAKRTKAIFGAKCDGVGGLIERAQHVFLLTGTPTPNHPAELWPMLRACAPETIGRQSSSALLGDDLVPAVHVTRPMAYWQFVEKFCVTRDNGFGVQIVKGRNLDELKRRIAPFVLRRKKEEVLQDLPPIRFDELSLDGNLFEHWVGSASDGPEMIAAIEKALEEDGIAGLAKIAPHVAQLRRLTGLAKVPGVVEWIKEQFEGGLKKLVVFAHHRDVVDQLNVALQDLNPVTLTGGTPQSMRQHLVDEFQKNSNCKGFIGQIQAAGTGITLTAASDLLFVESSWVPTDNEQAAMRIHRIGQKNACIVRFATLAGSIDERIQRAVMRKAADIAKLFG